MAKKAKKTKAVAPTEAAVARAILPIRQQRVIVDAGICKNLEALGYGG